jgi:pimeloyl-ACP methyl ester carboxylesterase
MLFLRKNIHFVWVLWTLVFVTACDRTTDPVAPAQNQYLVSNTQVAQYTREQVVTQLGSFGTQTGGLPLAALVQNGCTLHRLTYTTKNADGTDLTASGAVLVPTKTGPLSAISIQHGTIFNEADAPSYFAPNTESTTAGILAAAVGYLVVYPDYVGYGASKQVPHPYEHRKTTASTSYDLLRAVREFCKQTNIDWNNNLYLTGYSQGGAATMALQQKIESETPMAFALKAVTCGAGAYDKVNFTKYVLGSTTSALPAANSQYLWVMTTYNRIYNLNRPLSFFIKEPYLAQVQSQGVTASIGVSFNLIATDAFKNGILNGTDTEFINALKENDTYNFVPKTPTRLIYGTDDQQVFPLNSTNAFDAMKKAGATIVTLVPLPGKTHASAIPDHFTNSLQFFASLP